MVRDSIEQQFARRTSGSRELWERGSAVMPSGVSAAVKYFPPYPIYLERAEGSQVWDVDGNEYVDLVLGGSSHLLGHGHPAVKQAVHAQVDRFNQHLSPSALEVEMAELLIATFPYLECVRFTNTGSEAIRSCIRIARAITGRTMLGKCEGHYHGSDDPVLVSGANVAGEVDRPTGAPDSAGIPGYIVDDVLVLPFNAADAATALIEENADRLAAVLIEPIAFSTGGGIAAEPSFVRALREVTARHGILLIYDEVATGLRLRGGAAQFLEVQPDLSCVGKTICSGYSLAAFGGSGELMEATLGLRAADQGTQIFQSGTFSANPVALAAGIATLTVFREEDVSTRVDEVATLIRSGLDQLFSARRIPACTVGAASILQVHFAEKPPRNRRDILAGDLSKLRRFHLGLLVEGIFWTPIHPAVTCSAHSNADVDEVLNAVDRVLGRLA